MLSGYTEAPERAQPTTSELPGRTRPAATDAERAVRSQVEAREAVVSVAHAAKAQAGGSGGVLQVVHGARRVGWAAYELQRSATELVQGVAKPPYAATGSLDSLESRKLAEGVAYQVLYDRSALARSPQLELTSRLVALGEQARVVHVAPTKMIVVDNEVALLPLTTTEHTVESAVVIRSSAMLVAVMRIFEDMWRFAAPFTSEQERLVGDDQPSEEERWILSLLASGATDDTIGRLMGFSARTAHRRVRELIARLGVETRFQAGMQAVKLGWL
ncbi:MULTISPECIES: DNA-binding response regulator [unclassified Saccharopolyspora]|uniref:DNA-binding response regulator n=1 Tax=unclassified Saccharopolyspora TaxID=2646250 RepID=UPI001CD373C7|nr:MULTISPECIES: DNA-binding response regulator [unclassified Saccharopolyspora]MCA1188920.1 DNA-binding response regulator [Saccharopolyspora sp. 6T]MCA1226773.1 DNA-binding response regulator [Saccharopolyspora sp. 6M]MCA1282040.1 DNA-binding response regulator [Saccharopolyspora sp. 7B]